MSNFGKYTEAMEKETKVLSYNEKSFRTALPQILATMARNLVLTIFGMTIGFPAIVIPALRETSANAKLHLTEEEASWFGSILYITAPLGCIVSAIVTEFYGRKTSIQFLNILYFIGWLMIYYAESVNMLYFSLTVFGICGGIKEVPAITYVAESTQPHLRGFLASSSAAAITTGVLTQFLIGTFVNWRRLSLINSSLPVIVFITFCYIPESPYGLIGKGRTMEAEKAICWLRGWVKPEAIKKELNEIKSVVKTRQTKSENYTESFKNFSKRTFIRPFLLIMTQFILSNNTGTTTLLSYSVIIFAALGTPLDKYYATILLGVAQLLGATLCVVVIHSTGKRKLAICSAVAQSIFSSIVAFYIYFYAGVFNLDAKTPIESTSNPYSWIPLFALVGGTLAAFIGDRPLVRSLIGEVFPPEIKGFAGGFCSCVYFISWFAANKSFFSLVDAITLPGIYWFYSTLAMLAAVVHYFFLPETEGWSLVEIQEHFSGTRNLVKSGMRPAKLKAKDLKGADDVGVK